MIPSQKPMMLSSALELSKLVQEQEVVSWGEEKHVEKYLNTLKRTVEKLSQSNNLLASYHIEIIDKVTAIVLLLLLLLFYKTRLESSIIYLFWTQDIKRIRLSLHNKLVYCVSNAQDNAF